MLTVAKAKDIIGSQEAIGITLFLTIMEFGEHTQSVLPMVRHMVRHMVR